MTESKKHVQKRKNNKITTGLLLCVSLLAGFFYFDHPWRSPMLTNLIYPISHGFDKDVVLDWYKSNFQGFPAIIPTFREREQQESLSVGVTPKTYSWPVTGAIIRQFDLTSSGILLSPVGLSDVRTIADGKVIMAAPSSVRGVIAVIRHAEGIESVYGGLSTFKVSKDAYVSKGQTIGTAGHPSMYFSIIVNGQPVNPNDVIPFD